MLGAKALTMHTFFVKFRVSKTVSDCAKKTSYTGLVPFQNMQS